MKSDTMYAVHMSRKQWEEISLALWELYQLAKNCDPKYATQCQKVAKAFDRLTEKQRRLEIEIATRRKTLRTKTTAAKKRG